MTKNKQTSKNLLLIILGFLGLCFLFFGFFLKFQVSAVKKSNQKDKAILNQAFPGFNLKITKRLKGEVGVAKEQIRDMLCYFGAQGQEGQKDYDLSIYFAEELSKAKQFLKGKADTKQLKYPELDYKGKLPTEIEAVYFLNQLYGLKEVLSLGLDSGINFKSILPEMVKDFDKVAIIRLLRTKIEFSCLPQALIEFIIGLHKITPHIFIESIALSSTDSAFEVNLVLTHVTIDPSILKAIEPLKLTSAQKPLDSPLLQSISLRQTDYFRILRGNNPFFVAAAAPSKGKLLQADPKAGTTDISPQLKPTVRYLYKGRGILRLKEVAIIEDTLTKEIIFLGKNERVDKLVLKSLSDDEVTFKNLDDGGEIILKR